MNILITGGAGFIGSHLTRHLLDQGHTVHIIDDLSTGRRENIADLLGPKCRLQVSPVSEAFQSINWLADVDQIYHLAAAVGVQLIVDQPVHTIETNVMDTTLVLRGAGAFGIPTFIASSSEVYGKSDKVPFREDDDVIYGPTIFSRWSYAMTKAIDEYLALAYYKTTALPVVVARFFNIIGPRQIGRYGMVVPRFIQAALAGDPLTIYGSGTQTRCFSHVGDIVPVLPRLLAESKCHGRVFNVGSDEEISIEALADRIISLTGSASKKQHIPYEEAYQAAFDDLPRRVPDLTRIRAAIGFDQPRSLDEILIELIQGAQSD